MKNNEVLNKELEYISLCAEEKEEIKKIVSELILKLKKEGLIAKIGGSLAKGTMIKKDTQDIDLFIVFKNKEELTNLENKLLKTNLSFVKLHGSRDYFQIKMDKFTVELIPVIGIKNPDNAENVTDLSLMHVDYVLKKINKNKKLADEIKLAKAFCYAQGCYGAESYIRGFSGYALELLVIYFGSFINFIKKIDKERIIDPKKLYKNKQKIKEELNESKILSPVVLIDPTNKLRNACSSLSEETFNKFISASKKFIKCPSLKLFEKQVMDIDKIQKQAISKKAKIIQMRLYTDRQEGDIAATKMKKFYEFIVNELKNKSQKVLFSSFSYDGGQESFGFLTIKENKKIIMPGPSIKLKEAVKSFKQAHKNTFTKGNKIYSRRNITLQEIFNSLKRFEDEMNVRFDIN